MLITFKLAFQGGMAKRSAAMLSPLTAMISIMISISKQR
jgi:hypothetical protein